MVSRANTVPGMLLTHQSWLFYILMGWNKSSVLIILLCEEQRETCLPRLWQPSGSSRGQKTHHPPFWLRSAYAYHPTVKVQQMRLSAPRTAGHHSPVQKVWCWDHRKGPLWKGEYSFISLWDQHRSQVAGLVPVAPQLLWRNDQVPSFYIRTWQGPLLRTVRPGITRSGHPWKRLTETPCPDHRQQRPLATDPFCVCCPLTPV